MEFAAAIIGGTGIGERLLAFPGQDLEVETEFGIVSARAIEGLAKPVLAIGRHAKGHKVPPHKVPYRAFALACKKLQISSCFATAAVGALRTDWSPGTLANCSDFIDLTFRNLTIFENHVVHRDFTEPFSPRMRTALAEAALHHQLSLQPEAIYIGLNGPRYETPAEIRMLRSLGGDVVGMTATSEAIAMREAEVDYACIAIVTNLGSGLSDQPLDHGEVTAQMKISGDQVFKLLTTAIEGLTE
jgi:5'-methylthioadenosine phosphorylase